LANSGIGQASSTPAKAGTQVTILATGLGTKPDATKVSFGSFAAKQVAVAPSAYPGVFQIKATVPPEAPNGTLPVALSAATSYSDLADLAVVH
jgi:uncharacterized protein (TIGR03437 family)